MKWSQWAEFFWIVAVVVFVVAVSAAAIANRDSPVKVVVEQATVPDVSSCGKGCSLWKIDMQDEPPKGPETLLWLGVGGHERFSVSADGVVTCDGKVMGVCKAVNR